MTGRFLPHQFHACNCMENQMIDREELQLALEEESREVGTKRYNDLLDERGLADSPPGKRLLRLWIMNLIKELDDLMVIAEAGRAGKRVAVANLLLGQDTKQIALLALRSAIDSAFSCRRMGTAAGNIAGLVIEHIEWQTVDPALAAWTEKRLSKSQSERHRRAVTRFTVRNAGTPFIILNRNRVLLGASLLDMVVQATGGGIHIHTVNRRVTKKESHLVFNPEVALQLTQWNERCAALAPFGMPMIVPPTPWISIRSGGFRKLRSYLIKTHQPTTYEAVARDADLTNTYAAVNAVQRTEWEINRSVYDVMSSAWAAGLTVGDLICQESTPLPAKPVDIATNEVARKIWRRAAALVYAENQRMVSKRGAVMQQLYLAEKFTDLAPLYFVHTLDWRGRMYPVSTELHPQASDTGRALLRFHNGKPLGENGAYWLAVHIANLFGIDKVSFEERVAWVQAHEAKLLDAAMNPLDGERFWCEADAPWQALAACFEWMGYTVQGDAFISKLPVALDGSCNGLQNFSAILRDPIGGMATNLVPGDKPHDVYQKVADVVTEELKRLMVGEDTEASIHAAWWLTLGITRATVKRAVMTVPYGVTQSGMRDQLIDYLRKEGHMQAGEAHDMFPRCKFVAEVIAASIDRVVVAAGVAMGWLKDVARQVADAGHYVQWTAPQGFRVIQLYSRPVGDLRITVMVGGKRTSLQLLDFDSQEVDKRKQAVGVSPNFIHSYDAAHLMITVLRCADRGVTEFAMIHDSYGTLAADVDTMAEELREAFIEQYSVDTLSLLRAELMQANPGIELPLPPPMGSLELAVVKDSEYFFA